MLLLLVLMLTSTVIRAICRVRFCWKSTGSHLNIISLRRRFARIRLLWTWENLNVTTIGNALQK